MSAHAPRCKCEKAQRGGAERRQGPAGRAQSAGEATADGPPLQRRAVCRRAARRRAGGPHADAPAGGLQLAGDRLQNNTGAGNDAMLSFQSTFLPPSLPPTLAPSVPGGAVQRSAAR